MSICCLMLILEKKKMMSVLHHLLTNLTLKTFTAIAESVSINGWNRKHIQIRY